MQTSLDIAVNIEAPKRQSAALRYPGSKWSLANEIIKQFGEHYHYVEPSELIFQVTPIGCGLAGYKPEQVAPLFRGAPANCVMPDEFKPVLEHRW